MNVEMIKKGTGRSILQFAIPSIIAMLISSCVTIVDGFFIGNYIGEEGLAAVNLGLPILYLFLGMGLMVGIGGSSIAGIALGADDKEEVRHVFTQTILTSVLISFMTAIVIAVFLQPIMTLVHASGLVREYFHTYYSILLLAYPIMVINSVLGMFIRGEGKPQIFMCINILSVIINVSLDAVFVKYADLGLIGIAYASVIAIVVCLVLSLIFFFRKDRIYRFCHFRFQKKVFVNTILNGSSEFIGELSMCISMFAYNSVLLHKAGVNGVAAFTIIGYLSYIFNMIIVGFGQGSAPLISFTYGAKEWTLAKKLRKTTSRYTLYAGIIFFLAMLVLAGWYSKVFVLNTDIQQMIYTGVKIFSLSFLFVGINTITSFYFTSIGHAMESAVISSLHGLILILIFLFTLPHFLGINGVWLVAPLTELVTVIFSTLFIVKEK